MNPTLHKFLAGEWTPYVGSNQALMSARYLIKGKGGVQSVLEVANARGRVIRRRVMSEEKVVRWFQTNLVRPAVLSQGLLFEAGADPSLESKCVTNNHHGAVSRERQRELALG